MSGINIQTRGEYPPSWKLGLIQAYLRALADHRCEHCGMAFHPGTNLAVSARRRDGKPMIGTVHHIDGNKANCTYANLVFLCQSCHYRLHLYGWVPGEALPLAWQQEVPAWIKRRKLTYRLIPQPVLIL